MRSSALCTTCCAMLQFPTRSTAPRRQCCMVGAHGTGSACTTSYLVLVPITIGFHGPTLYGMAESCTGMSAWQGGAVVSDDTARHSCTARFLPPQRCALSIIACTAFKSDGGLEATFCQPSLPHSTGYRCCLTPTLGLELATLLMCNTKPPLTTTSYSIFLHVISL